MAKNLIVILGPTGIGKTDLSIEVAERYNTEIISSDSRQIYRDMVIGTAAPDSTQLARVKHHFIGILSPNEYYSAAQYETDVMSLLDVLFKKYDNVVMTGGSMMYIDAVCKGIDDIPTIDSETRQIILERYEAEGLESLAAELKLLDPEYYAIADIKNPKRVLHALEVCYMTGRTFTSFRTQTKKERPFNIIKIGLKREREELYDRINRRVGIMLENGLVDEVRKLEKYRNLNSLNTVGYKEIFKYLDGEYTLDFAADKIRQNSRIYSRKQMTWFKKDTDTVWFHPDMKEEIFSFIDSALK